MANGQAQTPERLRPLTEDKDGEEDVPVTGSRYSRPVSSEMSFEIIRTGLRLFGPPGFRGRHEAELLEHAELILNAPVFDYLAAANAAHVNRIP